MTEYIRCTKCQADWVVSEEDPDSTLSEAHAHIFAKHDAAKFPAPQVLGMIAYGVNRCRDGAHSTPHKGCILR